MSVSAVRTTPYLNEASNPEFVESGFCQDGRAVLAKFWWVCVQFQPIASDANRRGDPQNACGMTAKVLQEIGYSKAEIETFTSAGGGAAVALRQELNQLPTRQSD